MSEPQTNTPQYSLAYLDAELSVLVRRFIATRARCRRACRVIAHAGDGLVCMVALAAIALFVPLARVIVARMLVASLLAAALVGLGKLAFRRPRPIPDERHQWSSLGEHDEYAFPSGHAARTASIAAAACQASSSLGAAAWGWSIAVSLCRVALGAHYGADVIIGMLVGALSAWIVRMLGWP